MLHEGITHALRSSEYHDQNAQYHRIQEDLGVRKVHIYKFSRMNMVYTFLSKRNLRWIVENGKVDGWGDACFPTVQGIVRRSLKVEALVQFIRSMRVLERRPQPTHRGYGWSMLMRGGHCRGGGK
ncbi:Glutamate--tRNA ligase cytoplasmic [Euphorbia peplus]|nr:Glutamate--tRNA ligase cytoplasmic [Euphorbia peplus]